MPGLCTSVVALLGCAGDLSVTDPVLPPGTSVAEFCAVECSLQPAAAAGDYMYAATNGYNHHHDDANQQVRLQMNQKDWAVLGPPWTGNTIDSDLITPTGDVAEDGNLAIFTAQAFATFELSYSFMMTDQPMGDWSSPGVVFAARNSSGGYYVVDVPSQGQQFRGESQWATVSRVDPQGSGIRAGLAMERMPGVTSTPGVLHSARVRLDESGTLSVWIDGRPMPPLALGPQPPTGFLGLATYSLMGGGARAIYHNVTVAAGWTAPAAPLVFAAASGLPRPWRAVAAWNTSTSVGNMVKAGSSGELLAINGGRLLRSSDDGLSWTLDTKLLPMNGMLSSAPHGMVELYSNFGGYNDMSDDGVDADSSSRTGSAGLGFKVVSTNAGKNWSAPKQIFDLQFDASWCAGYPGVAGNMTSTECTAIFSGWAPFSPSFTSILRTKNGDVHLLGVAKSAAGRRIINYRAVPYGTALHDKPTPILVYNFAIRSTDGGDSFSAPANIDGSPASGGTSNDGHAMSQKEASEVSIAELASGELLALVRPNVSPFCWEGRSATGGTSWAPLVRKFASALL